MRDRDDRQGTEPRRIAGRRAGPRRPGFCSDLSAGVGIVAPLLALSEAGLGIRQWRDHQLAANRPTTPATIVSSHPIEGSRGIGPASDVVLSFRPTPDADLCRVAMRVEGGGLPSGAMATMPVVPRSAACEAPLLVADLADPAVTFAVAVALLIGAAVALKVWCWLNGPLYRADVADAVKAVFGRRRHA